MPERFRFSLQPLLDWRTRIEEEKQRDFAAARRLLDESTTQLERLADAYRRCAEQLAVSAATQRAGDFHLGDSHLRFLHSAIAHERSHRAELQSTCDRARDELVTATRQRRVIEKLKERRRREFDAVQARRAELELDEANAQRERFKRERLVCGRAESAPL